MSGIPALVCSLEHLTTESHKWNDCQMRTKNSRLKAPNLREKLKR